MKKEKITILSSSKKHIHLTAVLSLPLRLHERAWILANSRTISTSHVERILEVSQDGVVFETENTVYHLTYTRQLAEIEVMCA